MSKDLTPKQRRFVEEYMIDLNATQAAIRAGYSKNTAEWIGPQLLTKTHVAQEISNLKDQRSERTKIDAAWVLTRLAAQADADMADLYTEGGVLKPVHEWPEVWRKGLVAGVEVTEEYERTEDGGRELVGRTKKVKLFDRIKNLELIGKHVNVGAFSEKLQLTGKDDGPVQMLDVSKLSTQALTEIMAAADAAKRR